MVSFDIGFKTNTGNKRNINQDRIEVFSNSYSAMVVAADGMGGMSEGEIASQLIVDRMKSWWLETQEFNIEKNIGNIGESIYEKINRVNNEIIDYAELNCLKLGTTITVLYIKGNEAVIAYSGDTRVYSFCKENVKQLTEDESLYNYIEKYRVDVQNYEKNKSVLFSYLGKSRNLAINMKFVKVKPKENFVVCTDGLYNYINFYDDNIVDSINRLDAAECVDIMIRKVKFTEASDNLSLAVIKC